jgi:hypothetical protein
MNSVVDALKEIAAFPDNEDQMDEVMAFRWQAVALAREALASLKEEEDEVISSLV